MTQQTTPLHPLTTTSPAIVGATAFEGDLLSREKLAKRLTGYLDRLKSGAVLAIDAQWGDGKTWFGRNWAKHLEDNDHRVIYIDAFEQDYIEDPFLLIAAEIVSTLDDGNNGTQQLKKKVVDVMQAIMPIGAKTAINAAGRLFLGSVELADGIEKSIEAASNSGSDAASKWIEKKLKDYAKDKQSLRHFKEELAFFATEQNKPIVIFIDELDRCRPDFAVKLIERIKHFFDVPNVVFVLLINRDQLEKAIKGIYGTETDAAAYLSKFINLFFVLPKLKITTPTEGDHLEAYLAEVLSRYKFDLNIKRFINFRDCFLFLAIHFNLSLRDIEKGIALFAFSQPINKELDNFLAYVITLKIAQPELFKRLISRGINAHEEAIALINKNQESNWFVEAIIQMHKAYISNFTQIGEHFQELSNFFSRSGWPSKQVFEFIAERIDLPLEQ